MATCKNCGKKIGFLDGGFDSLCSECRIEAQLDPEVIERLEAEVAAVAAKDAEVEAVVLTTETAPNLPIKERIEIVTAECAFGMNIFKDFFAGVRDIVGGRSEAVQKTMRDARKTTLYELKKEAHAVGANAVVGVDLDYVEMSAAGSMLLLVASGTAVVIDREAV